MLQVHSLGGSTSEVCRYVCGRGSRDGEYVRGRCGGECRGQGW